MYLQYVWSPPPPSPTHWCSWWLPVDRVYMEPPLSTDFAMCHSALNLRIHLMYFSYPSFGEKLRQSFVSFTGNELLCKENVQLVLSKVCSKKKPKKNCSRIMWHVSKNEAETGSMLFISMYRGAINFWFWVSNFAIVVPDGFASFLQIYYTKFNW